MDTSKLKDKIIKTLGVIYGSRDMKAKSGPKIKTDIVGMVFGKLKVLDNYKRVSNTTYWLCRCECGVEKYIRRSSLKKGDAKSCGCSQHRHKIKDKGLSCKNSLFANYKRKAKLRNLSFDLTFEQFIKLTSGNCSYCNKEPLQVLNYSWSNGCYKYNGIDRVDNTRGYELDNCVSCCKFCNRSKDTLTKEEFLRNIAAIYENL